MLMNPPKSSKHILSICAQIKIFITNRESVYNTYNIPEKVKKVKEGKGKNTKNFTISD
ncbi:hypothetical protein SD77_2401 [Bacillus badius]|uniref:Ribose 5-phosphate isomerase B n=1 Tax=Bacillus badius TaxID=1455 RepID=A0ABR5AYZ8_BACBA|nr:hypothetical protein SD77_2401 [Bacillus badius]